MPAPRPRCVARGGFASTYNPKEYTVWKDAASELIRDAVPEGRVEEGDLEVILEVRKTRPKTTKLTRPGPDVDNYAKGVLDALTDSGRVWLDDKQVAHLRVTKRWTQPGETAGVAILIYPFKDT